MSALWPVPLHGAAAAGHHWGYQLLALAIVAGLWLVLAGLAERKAARQRPQLPAAEPPPSSVPLTMRPTTASRRTRPRPLPPPPHSRP